jgi:hypothetical protein
MVLAGLMATGCLTKRSPSDHEPSRRGSLVGAWRTQVLFESGSFGEMKGLQFMYVFNAGGTMTESSNYDGAPPVPPAYGVWRKSGPRQFEAKYAFYVTKAPGNFDEIAKGGGWLPAGHGVFTETIALSEDGKSYKSKIAYAAFDLSGKPAEGAAEGSGEGARIDF